MIEGENEDTTTAQKCAHHYDELVGVSCGDAESKIMRCWWWIKLADVASAGQQLMSSALMDTRLRQSQFSPSFRRSVFDVVEHLEHFTRRSRGLDEYVLVTRAQSRLRERVYELISFCPTTTRKLEFHVEWRLSRDGVCKPRLRDQRVLSNKTVVIQPEWRFFPAIRLVWLHVNVLLSKTETKNSWFCILVCTCSAIHIVFLWILNSDSECVCEQ